MSGPGRARLRLLDGVERGVILSRTLAGAPALEYQLYLPRSARARPPLLVAVHGISGRPRAHVRTFAQLAEARGVAVLAPHFAPPAYRDYQRLGRTHLGERADLALERLVVEVERLAGIDSRRFHLFGHSGGAQFAHRYAMAHPERVAAVVVASAGWYTLPDPRRAFPYGLAASPRLPGVRFDPERLLAVPMLVAVGERDVRRGDSLRRSPRLDRQQGTTRLERARRFVEAMAEAARARGLAPAAELRTLPGADHAFTRSGWGRGRLAELAVDHLFGDPRSRVAERPAPVPVAATARGTR